MESFDSATDRGLAAIATAISGPQATALALCFYAGVGLVLPLELRSSTASFVGLNLLGTSLAGLVSVAWLAVRVQAAHRRHLVDWTTDLRSLDAAEFEWLVGEVFRREGWTVTETGSHEAPDGNIDVKLSRDGTRRIVQCKQWSARSVGVDQVRGFAGTLLREGLVGADGIFVTSSRFTASARDEADRLGLTLIDGTDLFARMEQVRAPEPCLVCGSPMQLGRSEYGWWFRCTAAGCRGKRDLGRDAGRAVEHLLRG